ncbi:SCO family protein [Phreatobacter sp.]|uniref:SCO family protein n=1 Tax=Phreatobacter sp. TaxID=1966341 RepID=UPI003F71BFB7
MLKIIRIGAWAAVAVLAFLSVALAIGWWRVDGPFVAHEQAPVLAPRPGIGGPFSLTDHRGARATEKTFAGRPMMIFFGFTHCPDVCPTALFAMSQRLTALGAEGVRLQAAFVTVDPERDTVEQLALYLGSFDPRIVGLTGTRAEVDAAVAAFRVIARRVPLPEGGYTMDHSASIYLMDSAGRFVGTIDHHESEESALAKMRRLAGL